MGGTPGHRHLYREGRSPIHRLPAHVKIVAALVFAVAVVATPRERVWAFGFYAILAVTAIATARLPARLVATRMLVEIPFVVFAVLLPFVALGPRVSVFGASVSQDGLWAGWNILAKGTLGVLVAIVLAATTSERDLLTGLQRLRVPPLLVQIVAFMLRYAGVVADQMARMRIARDSRAFEARHLGHARVLAHSAGALFVRTYERGERVHLAMLSRGFTGTFPVLGAAPGASAGPGPAGAGIAVAWAGAAVAVSALTRIVP